jgi:hypothetical protein
MKKYFFIFSVFFFIGLTPNISWSELPNGFGGIEVGDSWQKLKNKHDIKIVGNYNACEKEIGDFSAEAYWDGASFWFSIADNTLVYMIYKKKFTTGADIEIVKKKFISEYGSPTKVEYRHSLYTLDYKSNYGNKVSVNIWGNAGNPDLNYTYQVMIWYHAQSEIDNRSEKKIEKCQQNKANAVQIP